MRHRIIAGVGAALLVAAAAGADEKASLRAVGEGRALFVANCSSCHGTDARGGSAPSLAALAARDGGFDKRHVANHIEGRRDGRLDPVMPVWGHAFSRTWPGGPAGAALQAHKLTAYLEFVQADARPSRVAESAPPR